MSFSFKKGKLFISFHGERERLCKSFLIKVNIQTYIMKIMETVRAIFLILRIPFSRV